MNSKSSTDPNPDVPDQDGSSQDGSRQEAARSLPDTVIVGRVRKPHGVRGEVRVEVLTDNVSRFRAGADLHLVREGQPARSLTIAAARSDKADMLVTFEGIDDRDAVEDWRGAVLEVDRASIPPAEDGTYYYFELVGCQCYDLHNGDLGEVVDVLEDGGGLLLLTRRNGRELPIPFVNRFIEKIDIEAGRIELDLPPGLVDLCTSKS